MKITHIVTSIDISTGGPARSVTHLIAAMLKNSNHKIDLFCGESISPIITNFEESTGSINFCKHNRLGGLKGIKEKITLSKPDLIQGYVGALLEVALYLEKIKQKFIAQRSFGSQVHLYSSRSEK